MMGLMILLFFAVYLGISLWVISSVFGWAAKNKRSGWWGGLAIFVMYNLVFWDWVPTVVMHKYYCDTQAGFWVYKTPEQWMKENPQMKEGVDYREQGSDLKIEKIDKGNILRVFLNQRSPVISESIDIAMLPLLHITKRQHFLIDTKKNYLLVKKITFTTGSVGGAPNSMSDYLGVNIEECHGGNGNVTYENWASADNKYTNIGEVK